MGDAVLPVLADDEVGRHVLELHCSRFGCGHVHVLADDVPWPGVGMKSVDWAALHAADHALELVDGTSPFGHVHVARAAA